ncbi:hypothetical protein NDU88_007522 [Pleurodeles waltl]|uniref:Uncharacterized protein n=1 Tax=Pleurodeles waltl TaxID=8319 RepID=A0AAV7N4B8_PLEWA|nr:hypothetical protein NDU88_007522 [Pleurodeles waltl]
MRLSLGQAPCTLAGRGQVCHLRPPWPVREASEVSPRHLRELSPVSQISCCRFCLLASSFSPHAGSVPVSAQPLSGALGPRSPGPRVATLPVLAIGHRTCLRSHNTASQWHPRCVSGPPEALASLARLYVRATSLVPTMGRVLCLLGQGPHVLGGWGQVRHPRPPRPVREASEVSPRRVLSPVASASPPDPLARTWVLSSFQLHLRPGRWGYGVWLLVWPRCPS